MSSCEIGSLNVQTYLSEAMRVLRPGGYFYISWYPHWQMGRGHHMHPDVVMFPVMLATFLSILEAAHMR